MQCMLLPPPMALHAASTSNGTSQVLAEIRSQIWTALIEDGELHYINTQTQSCNSAIAIPWLGALLTNRQMSSEVLAIFQRSGRFIQLRQLSPNTNPASPLRINRRLFARWGKSLSFRVKAWKSCESIMMDRMSTERVIETITRRANARAHLALRTFIGPGPIARTLTLKQVGGSPIKSTFDVDDDYLRYEFDVVVEF